MNIKDLNPDSYKIIDSPTNINQLKAGSYTTIDQSQASLAQSQRIADMQRQGEEAERQAKQAASPLGMAGETVKQTGKGLLDIPRQMGKALVAKPAIRLGQAIGEGVAGLFGKNKMQSPTEQPVDVPIFGKVEPQKAFGQGGATQVGAQAVESAVNILPETKAGAQIIGAGAKALGGTAKKVASSITKPITSYLTQRAEKKGLEQTIDAVYSSPTGVKFKKTSGQVLTGQRQITPASMFREQGLTPDQQTVNLGTRLKELKLGKDSVKNTQILADDMTATEAKLQRALAGDSEIKYLADKPKLSETLNRVKTEAPQEYRIKDSQAMVNNVVDFANKIVAKSDDSIGGIRESRKAFDAQAKREFPNAFRPDGTIDTKTPAGYAIKKVRDDMNEHLYNTAPNGSEIQTLIGREADLYKAAQVSLEKAMKGQGKTTLQQWAKEHPAQATLLGFGVTGVAGGVGGAAYGSVSR